MGMLRKLGLAKVTERLARAILGETANNLTATGSTQANAYRLEYDVNVFTTVPNGTGCILPTVTNDTDEITVVNDTAQAMPCYPPLGESINQEAVNVPVILTFGTFVFRKVDITKWRVTGTSSFSTTPPSSGTVSGPVSSTDNAAVRWNGIAGTDIQNSLVIIDDAGQIGGNVTPTAPLHIRKGTGPVTDIVDSNAVAKFDSNGNAINVYFNAPVGGTDANITMALAGAALASWHYNYSLNFMAMTLAPGTTPTTGIFLRNNRVGINNNNPAQRLTMDGNISIWSIAGIADEVRYIGLTDGATTFSPGASNGCWIAFSHAASGNQQSIEFYTAGTGFDGGFATRRGYIAANGFTGFGGSGTPSYGLHALNTFGATGAAEFASVAAFSGAIRLNSNDFAFSNTISANTNLARVTDTSSAWTLTLPTAAAAQYRVIRIIDASGAAGTNNITVDADGAELINGVANYVIRTNGGGVSVRSDGSNWQIIDEQKNGPIASVATAANDLTLVANSDLVTIAGTTEIQRITNTSWAIGSSCKLIFNGALRVKHNQSVTGGFSTILIDGNADYDATAGSVADLFFNGTNFYLRPYYTA